jgi:hypothetical protein
VARDDAWQREWWGMPEFVQRDLTPWKSIKVHFSRPEDMDDFATLVQQRVPGRGPGGSIWYPEAAIGHFKDKRYVAV